MIRFLFILLPVLALTACQREKGDDGEETTGEETPVEQVEPGSDPASDEDVPDIQSRDILERSETADEVQVKHVLLAWKELSGIYRGRMDPRAQKRTHAEAAKLAEQVAAELEKYPKAIDELVKKHSEDPGSLGGDPYSVTPGARFVPPFKKMALRLETNEVGIVRTDFGYHVMMRVPPPPPDPLTSQEVLEREPKTAKAKVKHILLGWKDANPGDPRGKERTREELEKLVNETVAKLEKGAEIEPLMAELSEDPGSAKSGKAYDVSPNAQLVPPFKNLSLRLDTGEVGAVKTKYGIHIIKRVE